MGQLREQALRAGTVVACVIGAIIASFVVAAGAAASPTKLVKPIAGLTPGVFNPAVRQSTIGSTICVRGWTKTIRPPVSYTNRLKIQQMAEYDETGLPSSYEEDHFIPLELGGAPRDPHNLWPEPRAQSRHSDPLETHLKTEVCDGAITLAQARTSIQVFKRTHG